MSRSSDPEYVLLKYIEPRHHVVVNFFNNTIQEGKIIFIFFINNLKKIGWLSAFHEIVNYS